MNRVSPEGAGLEWRKASYSATNGECVEVAAAGGTVAIRDSKNPAGLMLTFSPENYRSFIQSVRSGATP